MAKVDWHQGEYEVGRGALDALPAGRYLASISLTELKDTRAKTGKYIEVEYVVTAPKENKGRKLWSLMNVHNPSEEAERIGREQFNALANACGMLGKVQKTEQLHGKQLVLIVGVEEGNKGTPRNVVNGFEQYTGAASTARSAHDPADDAPAPAETRRSASTTKKTAPRVELDDDEIPF
jgi:hypothetical protein